MAGIAIALDIWRKSRSFSIPHSAQSLHSHGLFSATTAASPASASIATTVVTTRRILERLVLHYVSQRMARKLLKDVPKSATRKALRQMPTTVYFFCVSRTTLRGHFLGVAASWLVQFGIEIYRFFHSVAHPTKDEENVNTAEEVRVLRKKVSVATVRCSSSLVFASIGAGIGATLFRPSTGQWIGCALGDLAGPSMVAFCAQKVLYIDL